jgi:hypothetical protein
MLVNKVLGAVNSSLKDHEVDLLHLLDLIKAIKNYFLILFKKHFKLQVANKNCNVRIISEPRHGRVLNYHVSVLTQPTTNVDYAKENNTEKISFCLFTNKFNRFFGQLAHSLVFATTDFYTRICEMDKNIKLIFKNNFTLSEAVDSNLCPAILSLPHSDYSNNQSTKYCKFNLEGDNNEEDL